MTDANAPKRESWLKRKKALDALEQQRERRQKKKAIVFSLIGLTLITLIALYYLHFRHIPLPEVPVADEAPTPVYLYSIYGDEGGDLKGPSGVAISPTGDIYVSDCGNSRVVAFDPQGDYLFSFNSIDEERTLIRPIYLAINSQGKVYVIDRRLKGIFIFSSNGQFISEFKPKGADEWIWTPIALTFDDEDNLYVADLHGNHVIRVFNADGEEILEFGEFAHAETAEGDPACLCFPNGICVDENGDIYVADSNNSRIQVFGADGELKRIIRCGGIPRGIALGPGNYFVTADAIGHTGIVFSKDGEESALFGGRGLDKGQFLYPNGVAADGKYIFITDRENNRVQVWTWPIELPPWLTARGLFQYLWLLLLLLLLLYLWLRRKRHVMNEDFFKRAVEADKLQLAVDKLKRLCVTEEFYEEIKDMPLGEEKLGDLIGVKSHYEDLAEEFVKELGLSLRWATALSAAKRGIAKTVLLTDTEELLEAAEAVGVRTMTFGEFLEKYDTEEEPAAPHE